MSTARWVAVTLAVVLGVALVLGTGSDGVEFAPCPDRTGDACAVVGQTDVRFTAPDGGAATRVPSRLVHVTGTAHGERPELAGVGRLMVSDTGRLSTVLVRLRSAEVRVGSGPSSRAALDRALADGVDVVVLIDPPADLTPMGPPLDVALMVVAADPPPDAAGLAGITNVVRATAAQRAGCARDQVASFVAEPFGDGPRFVDCSVLGQAVS